MGVVVLTKDGDFVRLLEQFGSQSQILWLPIGYTSNARLEEVPSKSFALVQKHPRQDEPLVEIIDQDREA
jgi:predicted nuclease of predicted toxin-antitoxin system